MCYWHSGGEHYSPGSGLSGMWGIDLHAILMTPRRKKTLLRARAYVHTHTRILPPEKDPDRAEKSDEEYVKVLTLWNMGCKIGEQKKKEGKMQMRIDTFLDGKQVDSHTYTSTDFRSIEDYKKKAREDPFGERTWDYVELRSGVFRYDYNNGSVQIVTLTA